MHGRIMQALDGPGAGSRSPSVAIVHDYLTQRGGAERVVLAMARAFPAAPIYTALYEPTATFPEFADLDVRPMWTNRIRSLRRDHRKGLPLYPLAFSGLKIDSDVVLCSSSGFAHGVRTTGRKIVYCYTPARWLYDQADTYLARWPATVRGALRVAGPKLRTWDRQAMAGADQVLTSSTAVANRIRSAYCAEATVLPPPAGLDVDGAQCAVPGVEPGFVLSVGRLLAYKNVDVIVAAMTLSPEARLVIVGDGPELGRLETLAGTNVTFLGEVADAELRWLYSSCAGVASAAYEDFGLTPLEAASWGKAVAALRFGGFLDTVVEGETGVFFDEPTPRLAAMALRRLVDGAWDHGRIVAHADTFREQAFRARLRAVLSEMTAR